MQEFAACMNGKITCRIIMMGKRKVEGHNWGCVILVVEIEIEIRLIIITYSMLNQMIRSIARPKLHDPGRNAIKWRGQRRLGPSGRR